MNQATFNFAPKGKRADIAAARGVAAKAPVPAQAPANDMDPGDAIGFEYARYGIPALNMSRGEHIDYHQVTDEPQYIDYDQLARVTTLVHDVALRVANLDQRVVVDKRKPDPKGRCVQ